MVGFEDLHRTQVGLASYGGVFCNYKAFIRGSFVQPLGVKFPLYAEFMGFIKSIEIACIKGWFLLWLESDSEVLVQKVRTHSALVPWSLRSRWMNRLHSLEGKTYRISHIFREGNSVADTMANIGFTLSDFTWLYSIPADVWFFHERNLEGSKV